MKVTNKPSDQRRDLETKTNKRTSVKATEEEIRGKKREREDTVARVDAGAGAVQAVVEQVVETRAHNDAP